MFLAEAKLAKRRRQFDRGGDDAVDLIFQKLGNRLVDAFGGVRHHEDQRVIALLLQFEAELFKRQRIERVVEIAEQQGDHLGLLRDQRAGQRVRAIAEFACRPHDARSCLLGHAGLGRHAGKGAAHRRLRNAGELGHVH